MKISEWCKKNNTSLRKLAKELNLSPTYLCDIDHKRHKNVSEDIYIRLHKIAPEIQFKEKITKTYEIGE